MPTTFSNAYSFGTNIQIDLKPGYRFEFVCCLVVYKKLTNSDHEWKEPLFDQFGP